MAHYKSLAVESLATITQPCFPKDEKSPPTTGSGATVTLSPDQSVKAAVKNPRRTFPFKSKIELTSRTEYIHCVAWPCLYGRLLHGNVPGYSLTALSEPQIETETPMAAAASVVTHPACLNSLLLPVLGPYVASMVTPRLHPTHVQHASEQPQKRNPNFLRLPQQGH